MLIVDDDPLVRSALRLLLGGDDSIEIVGEAVDGLDAVDQVRRLAPDVVLMDVRMPRQDGVTTTARITAAPHPPAVIVLTTFHADAEVLGALRAGASGFLLKDTSPEDLVAAVHRVAAGEPMLSPEVTRQVIGAVVAAAPDQRVARARAQLDALSERERQIALMIGQGLTNADIAKELYLSLATVKSHVTHLLTKLDATNRVQIAIRVHDARA